MSLNFAVNHPILVFYEILFLFCLIIPKYTLSEAVEERTNPVFYPFASVTTYQVFNPCRGYSLQGNWSWILLLYFCPINICHLQ